MNDGVYRDAWTDVRPAETERVGRLPELGAFGVERGNGFFPWLIRVVTQSPVNHAGVYVGVVNGTPTWIEAMPGGAVLSPVPKGVVFTGMPLSGLQRADIVDKALDQLGVPYSWTDVICVGIGRLFRWHVPEPVRARLRRVDRLMCSQLVDRAYMLAGVQLFNDGRPIGGVAPGDLEFLIATDGYAEVVT